MMKIHRNYFQKLAVITFTTIVFYANSVRSEIIPDVTLPNNSRVIPQGNLNIIEGGTEAGSNLFHSFKQFSIPTNQTAFFNNSLTIQNIITRVTGKSISNINGTLRANGTANLFLINPNGIIFGENATLDIGGSFLASTASSVNFADGTKFSATQPETTPLLTINVPTGLQFGATAAPIRNQSQASPNGATNLYDLPVGLQVPTGKTLALIGGDVILEGGNLSVESGRIELASVGDNSLVSLEEIDKGWALGYEGVENFRNIQLIPRNVNGSEITSNVYVSNQFGNASMHLQGNLIESIGNHFVTLLNTGEDAVDTGDVSVTARKLVLRDGAQIANTTFGNSAAGNLIVNVSESLEIIGGFTRGNGGIFPSSLITATGAFGKAGNLTINTSRLLIKDGGVVSTASSGLENQDSQFITATGEGGNLIINASDSVELIGRSRSFPSSLSASTQGSANAGNLTISTKQLIVKDEGEISVSSTFELANDLGDAGNLNITTDSIILENQGKLKSETDSSNGGNINLNLNDYLLMRRNSTISTNAGKDRLDGDGGNINIDVPNGFIVAVSNENSDITANAFTGSGGRVDINAIGIFGIQPRSRDELTELLATNNADELNPENLFTSDISAISQQNPNLNGELNINVQDVEPTNKLVDIPQIPLDNQFSQVCQYSRENQSKFIYTRNGGLPPQLGETLRNDSSLNVGWVEFDGKVKKRRRVDNGTGRQGDKGKRGERDDLEGMIVDNRIVEATGWTVKNGELYFISGPPEEEGDGSGEVGCVE